jgi:hypothetical protein
VTKVVLVHGIAQQYKGPESVRMECAPALVDGVRLAGGNLAAEDLSVAFYGDLFRPAGSRGFGMPDYDHTDIRDPFEQELLRLWWEGSHSETPTRARTPQWVQRAVYGLCVSAGVPESVLIGHLKQVRSYMTDIEVRQKVQHRVAEQVDADVVIGHSLGSVVAYEVLCANDFRAKAFVTLGSPLGTPRLIFDRLEPRPEHGRGQWPRSVGQWTNIADAGDVVPLVKQLAPLFHGHIQDLIINNGAKAHDIRRYLTARETGRAVGA